ncbi:MAG: hypothetical protein QY330_04760 [Candidatus Dojkabacteria bacterium]|uniref:Uncharacterized protein n=2 Tax=Candidatus Dojkabacteria TaxID=74243 RepID=A0A136KKP5_9BACT|nr:MAG: hypothetical protein UZ20_WS6002000096 [candidate division WS6 bacterium OLB21]MBW7953552.1 hypothetical protein [Candidatus Dojkabacteria bacterium]WKZ27827.1 MAG: hypothetical protein QY330_04760 [Candidatus Dojkabacteria bacterium]
MNDPYDDDETTVPSYYGNEDADVDEDALDSLADEFQVEDDEEFSSEQSE